MAGEESKTSSVEDIAKMLLTPTDGQAAPVVEDEEDDNSPAEGTIEEDLTTDADENEQEQEDIADEDGDDQLEADDDPEPEVIDIRDEDTIDVMIDGKLEQRTVGELKKALSLAGATDKRLHEATEIRKAAIAERTTALEQLAAQERIVAQSLTSLEDTLFKAVIPAPPAALKSNPAAYLRHKEAYDEDQARIATARKAVTDKVSELAQQRQVRLKEYGEAAAAQIAQLIPELVDPKRSAQTLEKLVNTAKAYGYTEQEIGTALDPRMFHLVRDATAYRELMSRSKENVVDIATQRNKAPRKLRSGNTKAASVVAAKSKQQQEAKAAAAKTGTVSDVAKTLLRPAQKR
jgi:hypothetical protein